MTNTLHQPRRVCRGVQGGAAHSKKIGRKEEKQITKLRKFTKIIIMPFTNGSKLMSFGGSNPLTPIFFEIRTSPK